MNRLKPISALLFFALLFGTCKNESRYYYAIKDFRKELQPSLTQAVTDGIFGSSASETIIEKTATDDDLEKLSISEHSMLRAIALTTIINRKGFNRLKILMSHLDDTAVITEDWGEFGLRHSMVSDILIGKFIWDNMEEKNRTVEEVVLHHNYLRSCYFILSDLELNEAHYKSIKNMAEYDRPYELIEYALHALDKYKKPQDTTFIKQTLSANRFRFGMPSFWIFSNDSMHVYFDVLKHYYKRNFYQNACANRDMDFGSGSFFRAIASYQTKESADILDSIFNRKPFMPVMACNIDTSSAKINLAYAIWENLCEPYKNLRIEAGKLINHYQLNLRVDKGNIPIVDTAFKQPIRW